MYIRKKMSIFLQKKEYRKVRGEGILIKRIHNAKDHPKAILNMIAYRLNARNKRATRMDGSFGIIIYKDYSSLVQLVLSIRKYER